MSAWRARTPPQGTTLRERRFPPRPCYAAAITPKFYEGYPLPGTPRTNACGLIDAHRFAHDPQALGSAGACYRRGVAVSFRRSAEPRGNGGPPASQHFYTWTRATPCRRILFAYQNSGIHAISLSQTIPGGRHVLSIALPKDKMSARPSMQYSHVNRLSFSRLRRTWSSAARRHLARARNGFRVLWSTRNVCDKGMGSDDVSAPGAAEWARASDNTHASFETPCGRRTTSRHALF